MAVIGKREAEVAGLLRRISRFFHRAQQTLRNKRLARQAAHAVEDRGEILRFGVRLYDLLARNAHELQQRHKLLYALRIRGAVHTVEERQFMVEREFRRRNVRRHHHLLDELLRFAGNARHDVDTNAVFIKNEFRFAAVQLHGAAGCGVRLQNIGKLLRRHQGFHDGRVFVQNLLRCRAVQNFVDLAVHTAHLGIDDRLFKIVLCDVSLFVELDKRGEGQLVRARVQGARAV